MSILYSKSFWQKLALNTLEELFKEQKAEKAWDSARRAFRFTAPPSPKDGDIAIALFPFAGPLKMSPQQLAQEIANKWSAHKERFTVSGPYINIFLDRSELSSSIIGKVLKEGARYGSSDRLQGERIFVEFSSPNTNKPLHLGHLRNDILGLTTAHLLENQGATVIKLDLVNDRGIHICKSMLAYMIKGNGETPESMGIKGDHFVGHFYMEYGKLLKEDPSLEEKTKQMLRDWESGDEQVRALWAKMNSWAIDGIMDTYKRTGLSFDKIYFEHDTYKLGRSIAQDGLKKGVFYKDDKGSVRLDLSPIGLDTKVLLRSDGTTVYMTQDLGNAEQRQKDLHFTQGIYVVATEQDYHFKVLFYALKQLGFPWADKLHHLSYGMVNLPNGKMKSREGTIVDADELLNSLEDKVLEQMSDKAGADEQDSKKIAAGVALGALHYYLLNTTVSKDMIFDPAKSLSMTGNTGPYVQYVITRITSLLEKAGADEKKLAKAKIDGSAITSDVEWALVQTLEELPEVLKEASITFNCALLPHYMYKLAKGFSRFYEEKDVTKASEPERSSRLALALSVKIALSKVLTMSGIPVMEKM